MSYTTLDYLPDLSSSAMAAARVLSFVPVSLGNNWDYKASAFGSEPYALLHSIYRFEASAGATFDIFSTSFLDPFVLIIYDRFGNAIVANGEADDPADVFLVDTYYGQDVIWDWVAPYTGTYYVDASWHQGNYFTYYSLSLYEDVGTIPAADTTPPTLTGSIPASGASAFPVGQDLSLSFNEAVQRGQGTITLRNAGGQLIESFDAATSTRLSVVGSSLLINPTADLPAGTTFALSIPAGAIRDTAGNPWVGVAALQFSTPSTITLINGTAGSDQLRGTAGDDKIDGKEGDDTLWGGPGNDSLYGGKGTDTALFDGGYGTYSVKALYDSKNKFSGFEVKALVSNEGTDTVDQTVETLRFSDGSVVLSQGRLVFTPNVPADTTPPTVTVATDKVNLASGQQATITVVLSESASNFGASSLDVVGGTLRNFSGAGTRFTGTFVPNDNFEGTASIAVRQHSFADLAGNAFVDAQSSNSHVNLGIDTRPPIATGFLPATGARDVAPDTKLRVTFSESIQLGSGQVVLRHSAAQTKTTLDASDRSKISVEGNTLVIDLARTIEAGATYEITFGAGLIRDSYGNASAEIGGYSVAVASGANAILGTPRDDRLIGTAAPDVLQGLGGDDYLQGGPGDDRLDGGAGLDVARIDSPRAGAKVIRSGTSLSVATSKDGTDVLAEVERLQFDDMCVAFDLDGHAGTVARILGAVFGGAAVQNRLYVGIGLGFADRGTGVEDLCQFAIDARLGSKVGGKAFNKAVVDLVYSNVMGTLPSAEELAYFVNLLDAQTFTPATLVMLAMDSPMNEKNIGLVGLADSGLEYLPWLGG